jgi:putative transposase
MSFIMMMQPAHLRNVPGGSNFRPLDRPRHRTIHRGGVPEKITIDGSEANEAAIKCYNEAHGTAVIIRQVKNLTNIIEQDHRAVKRVTRPMLGFKSFAAAQAALIGIERMHMLKKGQLAGEEGVEGLTSAAQFHALAA